MPVTDHKQQKLLCISGGYLPEIGGMQFSTDQTLSALHEQGVDVTLIVPDGAGTDEFDKTRPFHIIRYGKPGYLGDISRTFMVSRKYKTGKYDRVMIMGHRNEIAYGMLCLILGFKPIILAAGTRLPFPNVCYKKWIRNVLLKCAYKNCDSIIAISSATIEYIQGYCHGKAAQLVKIPRPIDESIWDMKTDHIKRKSHKEFTLVTVSRLEKEKNIQGCLRLVANIRPDIPGLRYLIIGDGDYKKELMHLADKLNVKDIVEFVGYLSPVEVAAKYKQCDLFIMLSERGDAESFGRVYIEAAASGLPSIAYKTSGVVETVVDGETGCLVESGNLEAAIDAVLELYRKADVLERLSQHAYRNFRTKYTKEIVGRKLKEVLSV